MTSIALASAPCLRQIAALEDLFARLETADALAIAIHEAFPGGIALVSSFGADSAVLLHLVARIDRRLPVILLETGKLFPQTFGHRDTLITKLGLTDVRSVRPDPEALARRDPTGELWRADPDACCALRKVEPLEHALQGFDAWISGRRRQQSATREALPLAERDEAGRIKLNPLAAWREEDVAAYTIAHDLPIHPLVAEGYPSIGCVPCTDRTTPGEDLRAGRWRGREKTECGIHGRLPAKETKTR